MKAATINLKFFSLGVCLLLSVALIAILYVSSIMQGTELGHGLKYGLGFVLIAVLVYLIWRGLFRKARPAASSSASPNENAPVFHPSGGGSPSLSASAALKLETEFSSEEKLK